MIPSILSLGFALMLAVAVVVRYRRRAASSDQGSALTDAMIRRIEQEGRIEVEDGEPLDLDEIRELEEQFWEETWDEPDD